MIPLEFIFREKKADDFERLAFLVISDFFLVRYRDPRRRLRMGLLQILFVSYRKDDLASDFYLEKGWAGYGMRHPCILSAMKTIEIAQGNVIVF
jgi:hypothetical protein